MDKYKCHKIVEAAKIHSIETFSDGSILVNLVNIGGGALSFGADWAKKSGVSPGGYIVRYADGYTSFSPAKAFEEGYTKIV
jgi:hypothetical protein